MTAKEYLNQIRALKHKIDHRQEQIDELRASVAYPGAIDYAKDKIQSSNKRNMDDIVACYLDKYDLLEKDMSTYIMLKDKIIREVENLDNISFSNLLYKRYIEFKSLEQIAVEMCYSYDRTRHMHGYALQEFGRKYLTATHIDTQ